MMPKDNGKDGKIQKLERSLARQYLYRLTDVIRSAFPEAHTCRIGWSDYSQLYILTRVSGYRNQIIWDRYADGNLSKVISAIDVVNADEDANRYAQLRGPRLHVIQDDLFHTIHPNYSIRFYKKHDEVPS